MTAVAIGNLIVCVPCTAILRVSCAIDSCFTRFLRAHTGLSHQNSIMFCWCHAAAILCLYNRRPSFRPTSETTHLHSHCLTPSFHTPLPLLRHAYVCIRPTERSALHQADSARDSIGGEKQLVIPLHGPAVAP